MGVVIGETAVIGDNCLIYQGVTLGGTGKDQVKRHPTLGNNVLVGAGAKVLGPFTVGNNVKIAANAVVLNPLPDNCTAVGIPARIVKQDGNKVRPCVTNEIDQIHIPDPVSLDMCKMLAKIESLESDSIKFSTDFVKLQEILNEKANAEAELEHKYERWEYLNNLAEEIENSKK